MRRQCAGGPCLSPQLWLVPSPPTAVPAVAVPTTLTASVFTTPTAIATVVAVAATVTTVAAAPTAPSAVLG